MKSQSETDAEILSGAKSADVILPETQSIITRRHTRSVHPIACRCSLHAEIRFRNFSTKDEIKEKTERDWWQED